MGILDYADIYAEWINELQVVWTFLNTPLFSLLNHSYFDPISATLLNIVKLLGLGDFTVLSLIIGPGLFIYLCYQLAIWLFNLIT